MLACATNSIHEGAAKWLLPFYVHETLANVLNSHMCALDGTALIVV